MGWLFFIIIFGIGPFLWFRERSKQRARNAVSRKPLPYSETTPSLLTVSRQLSLAINAEVDPVVSKELERARNIILPLIANQPQKGAVVKPNSGGDPPEDLSVYSAATQNVTPSVNSSNNKATPYKQPKQPIDSVNFLLFAGALMVVVSALFYIGSGAIDVSGGVKFAILTALALLFYGAGLSLLKADEKYRPAALTFTGIGVVVIPLLVFAYRNFIDMTMNLQLSLALFTTLSAAIAAATNRLFKAEVLEFVMLGMLLASIQTWSFATDIPFLAANILAILSSFALLHYAAHSQAKDGPPSPARTVGYIGIGYSALSMLSLFSSSFGEFTVSSVTLMVMLLSLRLNPEIKSSEIEAADGSAAILLPIIGFTVFQGDTVEPENAAAGLSLATVAAYILDLWQQKTDKKPTNPFSISFIVSGLLAVTATMFIQPTYVTIIATAALMVLLFARGYMSNSRTYEAFSSIALLLPFAIVAVFIRLDSSELILTTSSYLVAIGSIILLGRYISLSTKYLMHTRLSSSLGSLPLVYASVAAVVSILGSGIIPVVFMAILIIFILAYGFLEKEGTAWPIAGGLTYILAVLADDRITAFSESRYDLLWLLIGLVAASHFIVSKVYELRADKKTGNSWLVSTLAGLFLSAALAWDESVYISSAIVGLIALVLFSYSRSNSDIQAKRTSYYVATLAASIALFASEQSTTLIQSALWSIPSFWIAYEIWREQPKDKEDLFDFGSIDLQPVDIFMAIALAVLTVPSSLEVLNSSGPSYIGLVLIAMNTTILLAGLALRYRLVACWGFVSLIVNILWETREFIANIPRQFLVFMLGITFIAVAIFIMSKRGKD